MSSSERLGADEHQMKIYRYNFELWLTGPIVMRMQLKVNINKIKSTEPRPISSSDYKC